MRDEHDVEAYLLRMNRRFSAAADQPGTYLVPMGGGMPPVGLRVIAPIVVLRVHIGDVAGVKDPTALYRKLLELNATALVHAGYGLDREQIVLSAALELENLDLNELQAALDEIEMALAQQVPMLAPLTKSV